MPKIIGQWKFKDGSRARIQEALRKGKPKIVLQTYKKGTWKTYQTLNPSYLPRVMNNIKNKGGVRV